MLKGDTFVTSLLGFFEDEKNVGVLADIVLSKRRGPISLRLIDYFVVSYAPEKFPLVAAKYDANIKLYHKKLFDPFCRGASTPRFVVGQISSTLAQLNFFRWLITSGTLDLLKAERENVLGSLKGGRKIVETPKVAVQKKKAPAPKRIAKVRRPRRKVQKAPARRTPLGNKSSYVVRLS
jgi:hypothetical protein